MIYTIISTTEKNKIEENRDCRVLRQPLSLLPKELDEFINNTKNDNLRAERYLAYTTLLCGIKEFFGIDVASVAKDSEGKPYLVYESKKYQKNEDLLGQYMPYQKNIDYIEKASQEKTQTENKEKIHISISHSDGAVAVSISDDGEIGVDIQSKISPEKANRLSNRFFGDVEVHSEDLKVKYYYCDIEDDMAIFTKINLEDADRQDYTTKWAYSESVMKLYGRGFGNLSMIRTLANECSSENKSFKDQEWVISTSIKI